LRTRKMPCQPVNPSCVLIRSIYAIS
jgi:hypothetical protein